MDIEELTRPRLPNRKSGRDAKARRPNLAFAEILWTVGIEHTRQAVPRQTKMA
jgi:hypothetical protein